MSDVETPDFQFDPDYQFKRGDKIYVIDQENQYDIWEAEITDVTDEGYSIHYPEYPDDDTTVPDSKSFLVRTPKNRAIFEEQEKVRQALDNEEADDFDMDAYNSDEDSDGESKKKKKKSNKKAPPKKKGKEPKPKKEKKPKEPKAKKEPKPKKKPKAKEAKKKKLGSEREISQLKHKIVKSAFQKGINNVDDFIKYFDDFYRPIYGSTQMDKISDDTVKMYERHLAKRAENSNEEDMLNISESDEDESDNQEEEEIHFDEPESLYLPLDDDPIVDGYEIPISNTYLSFDKNEQFPILFNEDDECNAFIYKTNMTQYLILNGMKFELQVNEQPEAFRSYFYEENKLQMQTGQLNQYYLKPRVHKIGLMKVRQPPECLRYMESKLKKKMETLSAFPELEPYKESGHSSKKQKKQDYIDQSRLLDDRDLEKDSDSD